MVSVQSVGRPGLAPASIASDFDELSRAVASFAQESLHATTRETLSFEILEESNLLVWLKCQEAHAKPFTR